MALALEDVEGSHPRQPWDLQELQRVPEALVSLGSALTPSPLPPGSVRCAVHAFREEGISGWRMLQPVPAAQVARLDPCFRTKLNRLAELEATASAAAEGGPMTAPTSSPENEGAGLLMAMAVGAALGNMSEAWRIPAIHVPGDEMRGRVFARLILTERTWPRSIIVNRKGELFVNEAANYNASGRAFHTFDPNSLAFSNLPAWLIVDSAFKFPIAGQPVGPDAPAWIRRGDTLADFAAQIDIDGPGLEAAVARFNEGAVRGEDPDFHRGESAYDSYNGDRSQEPPFTTLGPLDTPPYYAAEIESGALGTKGGPKTNANKPPRCRIRSRWTPSGLNPRRSARPRPSGASPRRYVSHARPAVKWIPPRVKVPIGLPASYSPRLSPSRRSAFSSSRAGQVLSPPRT